MSARLKRRLDALLASPPKLIGMVDRGRIEALLLEHYTRRPLMRATDFYKLIYQGVFGVGHIMGGDARTWLYREAEAVDLDDRPEEPLIEGISPDGSVVRVNLRPYIRLGLPLEGLFRAMEETALIEGSADEFMEAWRALRGLVDSGVIDVNPGELEELDEELDREGCKPHHHSEAYRQAYSPAYRVVRREYLAELIPE